MYTDVVRNHPATFPAAVSNLKTLPSSLSLHLPHLSHITHIIPPQPPSTTMPPSSTPPLHATYTYLSVSPSTTHEFTYPLPTPPPSTPSSSISNQRQATKQKTHHLSILRASVLIMQEDINQFLTAKMEEDKTAIATGEKVDDESMEERYGEEDGEGG